MIAGRIGTGTVSGQDIKSRPIYTPLVRDPDARARLLVTDAATPPPAAFAPGTTVADFPEVWHVAGHSLASPEPLAGQGFQPFRSASHLLDLLRHRLARETMGLRLYAVGSEHFCWDVAAVARAAGMGNEEIALFAHGRPSRRVICVHCRTTNTDVATNLIACTGCGAHLFVRDHFSRAHNAFMGVQIDAEAPGALIPVEDLTS